MPEDQVSIEIGGDISPLQDAIASLPSAASTAAEAVNAAFSDTSAPDKLTTTIEELRQQFADLASGAMPQLSEAAREVQTQQWSLNKDFEDAKAVVEELRQAYANGQASAQDVARAEQDMETAFRQANPAIQEQKGHADENASALGKMSAAIDTAKEVAEAFVAIALAEKLGEFASEAVTAYGEAQRVQTSLTLMAGSAEAAAAQMEELDKMAVDNGLNLSTLEKSAQSLSAVFGVGEGLTGVLQAAANVSAATGKSFDTVASSLARVEQTGAVSSRQLVALGLSWKDLAAVMGTSIDDAQKLLKKGGQDAEKDVEDLLAAIQKKFGQAAAEQAKGVLGQFEALKSQVEIVMQDIGSAVAPTLGEVVAFLRTNVVPAIKDAVDAFKTLSPPVQQFIILAGGAAVALVPVAAALATLGFAMQGLSVLLERVGIDMGAVAVSSERMALAEGGATVATTELAVAEAGLGTAVEGAAAAKIGFASAVDTAAGALTRIGPLLQVGAYVVLAEKVYELATAYASWRTAVADQEAAHKDEQDSLAKLEISLRQQGIDITDLSNQYHSGEISADTFRQKVAALVVEFRNSHPVIQTAIDDHENLRAAIDKAYGDMVDKQEQATTQWKVAQQVLADLQEKYGGQADKAALLARATQAVEAAYKAANPQVKDHVQTLTDLATKQDQANQNLAQAKTVLDQARAGLDGTQRSQTIYNAALDQYTKALTASKPAMKSHVDDLATIMSKAQDAAAAYKAAQAAFLAVQQSHVSGVATLHDVATAYAEVQKAAKAAGDEFFNVQAAIDAAKTAANDQITSIKNLYAEWKALNSGADQSAAAQLALAEVQKKLESACASLGISITKLGNGFQVDIADKSGKASAGVQAVVDALAKLLNDSSLVTVDVNGKLVPTMMSLAAAGEKAAAALSGITAETVKVRDAVTGADASVKVLSGSGATLASTAKSVASAASDAGTQVYGLGKSAISASDLVAKVNSTMTTASGTAVGMGNAVHGVSDSFTAFTGTMENVDASVSNGTGQFANLDSQAMRTGQTIVGVGGDFTAASSSAEAMDGAVKNLNSDMESGVGAAEGFASALEGVSSAASDAAASIASMDATQGAWEQAGGSGLNGAKMSGYEWLSIMSTLGALPSQIDSAAAAMGLVKMGERTYITQSEWDAMVSKTQQQTASYISQKKADPSSITKYDRRDYPELAAAYAAWAATLNNQSTTMASTTTTAADTAKALADAAKTATDLTTSINDAATAYNDAVAAYQAGTGTIDQVNAAAAKLNQLTQAQVDKFGNLTNATQTAANALTSAAASVADSTAAASQAAQAAVDVANAATAAAVVSVAASQAAAAAVAVVSPTAGETAATSNGKSYGAMGTGGLAVQLVVTNQGTIVGAGGMDQLASILTTKVVSEIKARVGLKLAS